MPRMETFVVRLWAPRGAGEPADDDLHGLVDDLRGAESRPFRNADELLGLLREELERREGETADSGRGIARP
jgi:hypothetical protein